MWTASVLFLLASALIGPVVLDDNVICDAPLLARRRVSDDADVHFIGLFDVHEGNNCHLLRLEGVEQVMMTISVLENFMLENNVNGSRIGFEVYDTCTDASIALFNLAHAVENPKCKTKSYVGIIGPQNASIQHHIKQFSDAIRIPYVPLELTTLKDEIKAISAVLLDLKWKTVALFSSSSALESEFRDMADQYNICIATTMILPRTRSPFEFGQIFEEISDIGTQVAVVLGSNIDLSHLYENAIIANSSIQYWLLAGMDTNDSLLSILFGPNHPVILFKKSLTSIPNIDQQIMENYEFGNKIQRLNLAQHYIDYIHDCEGKGINSSVDTNRCQNHQFRIKNPQWNVVKETIRRLLDDMEKSDLNISGEGKGISNDLLNQTSEDINIWTYQHAIGKLSKHKELQVGHYSKNKLILEKKRLNVFRFSGSGWFKIPEFYCYSNCHIICKNLKNVFAKNDLNTILSRVYYWKFESWVTILMTISVVGTITAVISMTYIIVTACKEDFEDGCQVTSVVILISVIFSYCCTILFMLQSDTTTCSRRIMVVGLAYTSLLAPVLARCFVIIASEMDGIHGHVSGFLQGMMTTFIFAVQAAMAAYYWVMSTEGKASISKCNVHKKQAIAYLGYSMLLSFSWLMASFFCIRSRRNNGEGIFLHFGSVATLLVWVIWYLLFFLLPSRWNEFTICFGLVATATGFLIFVFLPKIYRMITTIAARENGQVSMQPVIFASAASISPNLSIYESINHGYNPDKDGYVDVFREDDDSPHNRKMTHL